MRQVADWLRRRRGCGVFLRGVIRLVLCFVATLSCKCGMVANLRLEWRLQWTVK